MSETPREQLRTLLSEFETAMLVTRAENGELRSRPMTIADVEGDAELWFLTSVASGKIDEIAEEQAVNVVLQSDKVFISISGNAAVVGDHRFVEKLWKESFRVWFPEGKNDPELSLIRVVPDIVEYWDLSGKKGVRQVWEAARALLHRSRPEPVQGAHATLRV